MLCLKVIKKRVNGWEEDFSSNGSKDIFRQEALQ
jgi:hypothetical protein